MSVCMCVVEIAGLTQGLPLRSRLRCGARRIDVGGGVGWLMLIRFNVGPQFQLRPVALVTTTSDMHDRFRKENIRQGGQTSGNY